MSFYDCTFLDEVQFVLMMSAVVLILLLLSLFSILIPDPYSILRLQYLVIDISICIVIARLFIVSTYSFIITKMGGMCLVFLPLIGVVAWYVKHQLGIVLELQFLWLQFDVRP